MRSAASLALGLVLGASLVVAMRQPAHHGAIADAAVSTPDPFSQRNFPCQEDEALLYWPTFGPDKVGCMNVEEILP